MFNLEVIQQFVGFAMHWTKGQTCQIVRKNRKAENDLDRITPRNAGVRRDLGAQVKKQINMQCNIFIRKVNGILTNQIS